MKVKIKKSLVHLQPKLAHPRDSERRKITFEPMTSALAPPRRACYRTAAARARWLYHNIIIKKLILFTQRIIIIEFTNIINAIVCMFVVQLRRNGWTDATWNIKKSTEQSRWRRLATCLEDGDFLPTVVTVSRPSNCARNDLSTW